MSNRKGMSRYTATSHYSILLHRSFVLLSVKRCFVCYLTVVAFNFLIHDARSMAVTGLPTVDQSVAESQHSSVSHQVVATFNFPYQEGQFNLLRVNREKPKLYVGGVNHLFSLSTDLGLLQHVRTGPMLDNPICLPPKPQLLDCEYQKQLMNNVNKALLIDYVHRRLIVCHSLFHGFCVKRHLDDITVYDPITYVSVVANGRNVSTVAFIAPGPAPMIGQLQEDVFYVAVAWTASEESIYNTPAFASRNLTDFGFAHVGDYRQTMIDTEVQQRDIFPIEYIYGFSSEDFSYVLTVQKKIVTEKAYTSKVFRVCQNDKNFYSYVEIELRCVGQFDDHYNLLQGASLGKPGKILAQSFGIPTTEDVLFAVFSHGFDPNTPYIGRSAICIYPMRKMRQKFTEAVKRCFDGIGNTGPDHIERPIPCLKNTDTEIDDDYCGQTDMNHPIGGKDPIEVVAVLEFSQGVNVTSIAVSVTEDYTVAFVGTSFGDIMKVSLESTAKGNIYDMLVVQPNASVKRDLLFDEEQQHLYVLTDSTVSKVRVEDCSRYRTCSKCLGLADPYCGWCTLSNKCSVKVKCRCGDLPKRWLPYSGEECTMITSVQPNEIPTDKVELLTVQIQNLPEFEKRYVYGCAFSTLANTTFDYSIQSPDVSAESSSMVLTVANRTLLGVECFTPDAHRLPPVEPDSIVMRLAVVMNEQELISTYLTFYDCSVHTSCTRCIASYFACTWCVKHHRCSHRPDLDCLRDVRLSGQQVTFVVDFSQVKNSFSNSQFLNATESSLRTSRFNSCPRFQLAATADATILVPADTRRTIVVHGLNLQDFQKEHILCEFYTDRGHTVKTTITTISEDRVLIECHSLNFNYYGNTSLHRVPFDIHWGRGRHPLDNPTDVQVLMYKCSSMAKYCGECFSVQEKYGCGWCDSNKCITERFCQPPRNSWMPRSDVCPDVQISSFYPTSGPSAGGTRLTVMGQNLGNFEDNVEVYIDGVVCTLLEFQAPIRLVCVTQKAHMPSQRGRVRVVVGNQHSGESKTDFRYVVPRITGLTPRSGPTDGGTLITLLGEHLDAGSLLTVTIGNGKRCVHPTSLDEHRMTCTTTRSVTTKMAETILFRMDYAVVEAPSDVYFVYNVNPVINGIDHKVSIASGGLKVKVIGTHMAQIEHPSMLLWYNGTVYNNTCQKSLDDKSMWCLMPAVPPLYNTTPMGQDSLSLAYGFQMDGVLSLNNLTALSVEDYRTIEVFPNPTFSPFGNGQKLHQKKNELFVVEGTGLRPLRNHDVHITIGVASCTDVNVASSIVTCKPPTSQPSPLAGNGPPDVVVTVGNLTFMLGHLQYEETELLSMTTIAAIALSSSLVILILLIVLILYKVKSRRSDDLMKKMRNQMSQLEARVANECKEAFTELQTDMTELTSDDYGQVTIPFWDYKTYCMRIMFPGSEDHLLTVDNHLSQVEYHYQECFDRGIRQFSDLASNKIFVLTFVRTLETNKSFNLRDRVNVASLLSVALQKHMEYATEILKTLLSDLIDRTVESKSSPKLLLRRNESVAEKMLTNWFTFLLYKFLKECVGEPLFMLFQAMKQQTSKGPVDAVTGEARYSLSEDKLIRQQINYKPLTLYVLDVDMDRCSQATHPVKVLDMDTISQVKEKILDSIYKNAPFSSRPLEAELDLVLFDQPPELICNDKNVNVVKMFPNMLEPRKLLMYDDDQTSKVVGGGCRRLNTLLHYQVPDGAFVALNKKQMSSLYNVSLSSDKSGLSSFYDRSPSMTRKATPQQHVVDVDNIAGKHYHLVKYDAECGREGGDRGSKMVSEIYLPRLLVTKGTLHKFVDDLFERIFSTAHRGSALPMAIKYMFDFLDEQALLLNIQDPDVVHTWKSNSLPLRFWVNIIKNPDFAFDVHKTSIVDSCLTVVSQTFMDACSRSEHRLGKDSPSSKLLYAKDIPKYKRWVERYYRDIKMMPAISDQDMSAMLMEESQAHATEFNRVAALLQLYKYAKKYNVELKVALEEDEFARKHKLSYKLDQVHTVMDGLIPAVC